MFGIFKKSGNDKRRSTYTMLVNCSYGFLGFTDDRMQYAIYENKYTGKLIKFCVADASIEPVNDPQMICRNLA